MAKLKEEDWLRGKTYESKTGEKITILEIHGRDWVKILNGEGKLEQITKNHLSRRLSYGIATTSH